ncbi:hypothetical protein BJX70DRAFT_360314 [Aspergillus crustosus]
MTASHLDLWCFIRHVREIGSVGLFSVCAFPDRVQLMSVGRRTNQGVFDLYLMAKHPWRLCITWRIQLNRRHVSILSLWRQPGAWVCSAVAFLLLSLPLWFKYSCSGLNRIPRIFTVTASIYMVHIRFPRLHHASMVFIWQHYLIII